MSLVLLTVSALTLSACAANEMRQGPQRASALSGTLNGIGSSAQGPAQTTWIAGFQTAHAKVTINYDPQGSGAGRKSFLGGSADFAGSDAALSDTELASGSKTCAPGTGPIDLPNYISPIAIAYNVDGLKDLRLDAKTIAEIFTGALTSWNDPALARLNPGAQLPDAAIHVVHRSDDSGTTQNFSEYLKAAAPEVWDAAVSQTYPYQIGDAAKGTSGVADAVKNAKNTITYIDDSGASGLGKAQLKVGDEFVRISAEGAAEVVAASPTAAGRAENDLAIAIDRTTTAKNAWPLVLVSYFITCVQYQDPAKGVLAKAYAGYITGDKAQQDAATSAGSAPLSPALRAKVAAAVATIK